MAKISVVMSVYNGEKFVKQTVASILNQTFRDFEFIIIDDGSTDSSKKIIESFNDHRINLISRENKGLTPSLNEGLSLSRGKYIARMDADDIAEPERFEKQINFLDSHSNVYICGTWAKIIDENNKETGKYKTPVESEKIKRTMLWHNPFIHPSTMFRREIIDKVGYYSEKTKYAQDYEYWSRIIKKFSGVNIPEFLMKYRVSPKSMTRKSNFAMRWEGIKIRFHYIFS
jgi:glycosyltransferase involved in cell wall biosynthesis